MYPPSTALSTIILLLICINGRIPYSFAINYDEQCHGLAKQFASAAVSGNTTEMMLILSSIDEMLNLTLATAFNRTARAAEHRRFVNWRDGSAEPYCDCWWGCVRNATLLHRITAASCQTNVSLVAATRLVLEEGALVDVAEDADALRPLHLAAAAASPVNAEIGRLLLAKRPNLEVRTRRAGWTPLMYAAAWGRTLTVEWLLDHGAQVNATDNSNRTALFYSAVNNRLGVVYLLLQRGANRDDCRNMSFCSIMVAPG